MTRSVFNFSAGPAVLPEPVLRQAAAEMLDWRGTGMSVMEMSHRGPEFTGIAAQAERDLRDLMAIPDDYAVLFMQGGALAQNALVPMNLLRGRPAADYLVTGQWSTKSAREASRYCEVNVVADAAALAPAAGRSGYTWVPPVSQWRLSPQAAYLHLCTNETIDGVEFVDLPSVGAQGLPAGLPVVADMSSHLLSRPVEVRRFGCIYGGAQKNIGPAGLTLVIVREDLIGHAQPATPTAFDYRVVADNDSMFNTPPTWAIYMAGLVFRWIKAEGGVAAMAARNAAKAALLYGALDASGLFVAPVAPGHRSRMNVVFRLRDERLDGAFLEGAQERGLAQLKGHRSVGGMRASIYNAMPIEGVQALVDYLREFERAHG